MSKAALRNAQESYDVEIQLSQQAQSDGRFAEALRHAKAAWEFADDMMKFERRWEDKAFKSLPCIDFVIRYAPLRLDSQSLDSLEALLRSKKSIDRHASDDLAARLADAREVLRAAYRMWAYLVRHPNTRQDRLNDELGGQQATWRWIAEYWEKMGLLSRTSHGGSYLLRLTTQMDAPTRGKCSQCGAIAGGRYRKFLRSQECPRCKGTCDFVVLGPEPSLAEVQ